jgi:xanthine dehydrogenase YagS FAD-binding subunit
VKPFAYRSVRSASEALSAGSEAGAAFIAGGTTLLDLMKLEVLTPDRLIDLGELPLLGIEAGTGGLRVGAMERMSDVAAHAEVVAWFPVVAEALLAGASPQLRNMATIGGNLLQRTRCPYYRDLAAACNRRRPGSGCGGLEGENRGHAILGGSERCVATHPSDLAVALLALDARVRILGQEGERTVSLDDFYFLPGETPQREHALVPGELILAVEVPSLPWARRSRYVKVRDRASFEFALVSAAVALDIEDSRVRGARIAAGGVGTKPWRLPEVEEKLLGREAIRETFEAAAERAGDGARPLTHNGFKVELLRRTLVRALLETAGVG